MSITETINRLKKLRTKHGDVEVRSRDEHGNHVDVDESDITFVPLDLTDMDEQEEAHAREQGEYVFINCIDDGM